MMQTQVRRFHMFRHRRLGDVQLCRRMAETQRPGRGFKGAQPGQRRKIVLLEGVTESAMNNALRRRFEDLAGGLRRCLRRARLPGWR